MKVQHREEEREWGGPKEQSELNVQGGSRENGISISKPKSLQIPN